MLQRLDIKDFGKCDFSQIARYLAGLKDRKMSRTKEEKLAEKAEKKKIDDKFGWALLDGRKEKVQLRDPTLAFARALLGMV